MAFENDRAMSISFGKLTHHAGTIQLHLSRRQVKQPRCFAGMRHGLDVRQTNLRVWTPDAFGSVCFLIASEAAFARVCGRWACLRGRSAPLRLKADMKPRDGV